MNILHVWSVCVCVFLTDLLMRSSRPLLILSIPAELSWADLPSASSFLLLFSRSPRWSQSSRYSSWAQDETRSQTHSPSELKFLELQISCNCSYSCNQSVTSESNSFCSFIELIEVWLILKRLLETSEQWTAREVVLVDMRKWLDSFSLLFLQKTAGCHVFLAFQLSWSRERGPKRQMFFIEQQKYKNKH